MPASATFIVKGINVIDTDVVVDNIIVEDGSSLQIAPTGKQHPTYMKPLIKKTILTAIAALFVFSVIIAQPPSPPGIHGSGFNLSPPMQEALIGGRLAMLLALGAAYTGIKTQNARKQLLHVAF